MLQAGERAPAFALESDAGRTVSLEGLRGRTVVLYFYPKDDTPGCTREAQAFTALAPAFAAAGAVVLGVSKDTVASHCKFRDKYVLGVELLSDPDLRVHRAYGAFGEKTMYGKKVEGTIRSTFVISSEGALRAVFPNVKVDGHAEKVLDLLQAAPAATQPSTSAAKVPTAASKAAKPAAKAPTGASKAAKPAAKASGSASKVAKPAAKSKPRRADSA